MSRSIRNDRAVGAVCGLGMIGFLAVAGSTGVAGEFHRPGVGDTADASEFDGSAQRTEESFIPNFSVGGLEYLWVAETDVEDGDGSLGVQEAGASANFPLLTSERIRLTLGARYRWNRFDASGLGPLDGEIDLHRVQVPLNLWIDAGERWRFWLRAEPGLYSDFDTIDSDAFAFSALALASYQMTDTLRVAFGGYYSRDVGDDKLLPAAGFIWRPGEHWILSLTVPRVQVAYAPDRKWLFTLDAYPSGGKWNIREAGEELDLQYKAVRVGVTAERQLGAGPVWIFAEGGVQFAQELEIDRASGSDFDEDLGTTGYAGAGLRLRF